MKSRVGRLVRVRDDAVILSRVQWCASFFCKLRGLMFRRSLTIDEGLLLVEEVESRASTSIHMLFMAFPIAVVWLDEKFHVVDVTIAKPWRPAYIPRKPARYTLEAAPQILDHLSIGDAVVFESLPL